VITRLGVEFTPVIQAFGRQKKEGLEFKPSLGYIARLCLNEKQRACLTCARPPYEGKKMITI
jgi:hypothetical protein